MAKTCCVCGRNIGFMDSYKALQSANDYVCERCNSLLADYINKMWASDDTETIETARTEAGAFIASKAQEMKAPEKLAQLLEEKYKERMEYLAQQQARTKADAAISDRPAAEGGRDYYAELCGEMILSTAGHLEGYRVVRQLGVVYGETVFKPSAGQQFVSAIGDAFRAFSFSAKEMSGQVSIIEEARKFAYVKMMREAKSRGANAIIAIDSDNTIGDSICYLSLYGTAVYVEPVQE